MTATSLRTTSSLLALAFIPGAVAAALPSAGAAQNVLVDEGTFVIYMNDQRVGQEDFSIRRLGTGTDQRIIANAVVDLGDREVRPLLEATSADFRLTAYEVKISGAETVEVAVRSAGPRYVAMVRSPEGEQEREFRAREGAVLLEDLVAHQYHFVVAVAEREGQVIPIIVPRGRDQVRMEVRSISDEAVQVGGQSIGARRYVLAVDGVERRIWVDREGRVLRVDAPSLGYRAERQAPPA